MSNFVKDKIAVVTGATSGIGREAAYGLANQGARVVVCGRSEAKVEATIAELVGRGVPRDRFEIGLADLASVASTRAGGLDLADLDYRRRRWSGVGAYSQSKQANRMLAWAWDRRLAGTGVTINVAHPGGVATGIAGRQTGLYGVLARIAFRTQRTPTRGADTPVWLASSPELDGKSGGFYKDRRALRCEWRGDIEAGEALWRLTQEQIGRA